MNGKYFVSGIHEEVSEEKVMLIQNHVQKPGKNGCKGSIIEGRIENKVTGLKL